MRSSVARNEGAGWYAACQEGAYENTHIAWYWCGSDPDKRPDTYSSGLGTPEWVENPEELEN